MSILLLSICLIFVIVEGFTRYFSSGLFDILDLTESELDDNSYESWGDGDD